MLVPLAFEEIAVFLQERNSLQLSGDFFLPPQEAQISSETPAKTKVSNHKLKCLGQLRFYHQNKTSQFIDTALSFIMRKPTFAHRRLLPIALWKGEMLFVVFCCCCCILIRYQCHELKELQHSIFSKEITPKKRPPQNSFSTGNPWAQTKSTLSSYLLQG